MRKIESVHLLDDSNFLVDELVGMDSVYGAFRGVWYAGDKDRLVLIPHTSIKFMAVVEAEDRRANPRR